MRINARCSRSMMFANFLCVWVGGLIGIKLLIQAMESLRQTWFEDASWFTLLYRNELRSETAITSMMFVALFPIICRRCGVVLTLPSLSDSTVDQREPGNTDESTGAETGVLPQSRGQRIFGASGQLFGGIALVVMLAAIMLYPFTQVVGYMHGDDLGYRIGGWPFTYWVVTQIEPTDAAWYWTEPEIWQTVRFQTLPLLIDIALVVITFLLVFPIAWIRRTLTPRGIQIGRYALGFFLLAMLAHSVFGAVYWRQFRYASIPGLAIEDYDQYPRLGLFESIAQAMDTSWRGTSGRLERGLPSHVTLTNAAVDVIDEVVSSFPLRYLKFENCKITPDQVEKLANNDNLLAVTFSNCNIPSDAVETLVARRLINSIRIDEKSKSRTYRWRGYSSHRRRPWDQRGLYDMELVSKGGEHRIGENIESIELTVPDHVDSRFVFHGCENLLSVRARNSVGEIPDSVSELIFPNAPQLKTVTLDNYQKFAVSISSAPRLQLVNGYFDDVSYHEARLVSLKITGENDINSVCVDVSQCEQMELGTPPDRSIWGTLQLSSQSGIRNQPRKVLSAEESRRRLASLTSLKNAYRVVLRGFMLDAATLDLLPTPLESLHLEGCVLVGENEASLRRRWPTVTEVVINDDELSDVPESRGDPNE
ncbi:putative membrane protein [Rhodopirellula sallentina SM41]|uniref:Putative membrane protein n=2 Tax=Rhodopirellula TaxID=265488 RepID=M5UJL9_9BACT|nr:putative membrane protein [Rhodopirellula sallentina SM41]